MKVANIKLPELDTRSILDVVEGNFTKLGLKTYAVRMIYTGEHTLTKDEISEHFRKSVKAVNASYCEIHIHGFLLVYDSYFVHILEGSEDTLHRQLRFLFKREVDWIKKMQEQESLEAAEAPDEEKLQKEWKMFRRLKMLMVYHSIQTIQFDRWSATYARPPSLVGTLNVFGPIDEHMEQLRICLDKITRLCALAKADGHLSFEGLLTTDPKIETLPEVALLDFLLQSPHLLDLRTLSFMHRRVDDYPFYFEMVWPIPTHFTPSNLYKLKIDDSFVESLPVMPWEGKAEEKEMEENEERQSISSDSD